MSFNVETSRNLRDDLRFVQSFRRPTYTERTVLLESWRYPGFLFQSRIEVDVILAKFRQGMSRPELHNQAGSMPGCAGSELMPLEQNDIVNAEIGQVIGNTGPSNTATTDDDLGMSREIQSPGYRFSRSNLLLSVSSGRQAHGLLP